MRSRGRARCGPMLVSPARTPGLRRYPPRALLPFLGHQLFGALLHGADQHRHRPDREADHPQRRRQAPGHGGRARHEPAVVVGSTEGHADAGDVRRPSFVEAAGCHDDGELRTVQDAFGRAPQHHPAEQAHRRRADHDRAESSLRDHAQQPFGHRLCSTYDVVSLDDPLVQMRWARRSAPLRGPPGRRGTPCRRRRGRAAAGTSGDGDALLQ